MNKYFRSALPEGIHAYSSEVAILFAQGNVCSSGFLDCISVNSL